ncbi:MAG TPA: cbb3-type cytochrome c oxidase subunit I [Thermodesulfobacteriota bacterium]|nr:cbb3-type cytochrome c oxidase subunit I [Thermodesulfobacteriota bacterium]
MSRITVGFIKCALVYFIAAMLLGIYMSASGRVYPWMPIHVHFNLLGWMSMMIFGVGYHILPRFSGRPLWSDTLSVLHIWLANIGLVGMAAGWMMRGSAGTTVLVIFSIVEAVSIIFFATNMFKTIKAVPAQPKPAPAKG